jgi:small conductance mechanosensitive channel
MEEVWRQLEIAGVEYGGRLLGALLLLGVGWLAVRLLVGPLRRLLSRSRIDPSLASFLASSARTVIQVAIILGVLQQLGVHTASLLTLLGAAGVAVALSLQGSLANFASGILLLSFRTVRVGDLVEVGDIRGRVSEMLPFHVVVVTADNLRVTLPNTLLTGGAVRNHSVLPTRRVEWKLPLAASDDLALVKDALRTRLLADARILKDDAPQLFVQEWSDDKRTLCVQAWVHTSDYLGVQQELLERLGESLVESRGRRE